MRWATGAEVGGPLVAGGIRVRRIAAVDGARFNDHVVDETFGKPCRLQGFGVSSNGPTCSPDFLTDVAGVEGADCMSTVEVWRSAACADSLGIAVGDQRFAL